MIPRLLLRVIPPLPEAVILHDSLTPSPGDEQLTSKKKQINYFEIKRNYINSNLLFRIVNRRIFTVTLTEGSLRPPHLHRRDHSCRLSQKYVKNFLPAATSRRSAEQEGGRANVGRQCPTDD